MAQSPAEAWPASAKDENVMEHRIQSLPHGSDGMMLKAHRLLDSVEPFELEIGCNQFVTPKSRPYQGITAIQTLGRGGLPRRAGAGFSKAAGRWAQVF